MDPKHQAAHATLEAAIAEATHLPVLDALVVAQFVELLGEKRAVFLVSEFTSEIEALSTRLENVLHLNELTPMRSDLHQASGAAATFGLRRLRAIVLALEQNFHSRGAVCFVELAALLRGLMQISSVEFRAAASNSAN
ncbi:Hpt domain-containing protein [Halocynthiibacter sp. C4]|uniref:Hpt domain-containing protein n=1 Tax=Halocynthiibacter sp. C4 TaxID=2992758 RepID=UPI00237B9DC5|nr:Hpt domain-containing protein [Halocynthiibacter sp. C4]MDE0590672.1 Hpt domain-containing protein [Halocynthiibacter sp. C4]